MAALITLTTTQRIKAENTTAQELRIRINNMAPSALFVEVFIQKFLGEPDLQSKSVNKNHIVAIDEI